MVATTQTPGRITVHATTSTAGLVSGSGTLTVRTTIGSDKASDGSADLKVGVRQAGILTVR